MENSGVALPERWAGVGRLLARFAAAGSDLVDLVLPPRCLGCGELVDAQGQLCPECWTGIGFALGQHCRNCALPLPDVSVPEPICGRCLEEPPVFERARAALHYEGTGRRLILRFKHGDRVDGADTFANWMVRAGKDLLETADLIVPVPLHRWRLVERGYNQSAVLARALGRVTGRPVDVDSLEKCRRTESQQLLSAAARRRNVRTGAFRLSATVTTEIRGQRILLIDDVLTTGTTANACAQCLLAGGAEAVDLLVLARVVQGG